MCTLPPVARGSFCGFPRPLDVTHGPITSCALMCRAVPAALRTLSASDLELAVSLKGSGFLVSFRMKRGEDAGRARGAPGCRAGAGGQPLRRAERRVSARAPRPSEAALPPPLQAWGLPSRLFVSARASPVSAENPVTAAAPPPAVGPSRTRPRDGAASSPTAGSRKGVFHFGVGSGLFAEFTSLLFVVHVICLWIFKGFFLNLILFAIT